MRLIGVGTDWKPQRSSSPLDSGVRPSVVSNTAGGKKSVAPPWTPGPDLVRYRSQQGAGLTGGRRAGRDLPAGAGRGRTAAGELPASPPRRRGRDRCLVPAGLVAVRHHG